MASSAVGSFLLLTFLSVVSAAVAANVLFVDNANGAYLRSSASQQVDFFSPSTVVAANAILLGIGPPTSLDVKSAAQLDALLVPDVFKRPGSVAIFAITGLPLSATLASKLENSGLTKVVQRSLATPLQEAAESSAEETLAAASLLHELEKLQSTADENLQLQFLSCQYCNGDCLDKELLSLAEMIGGKYIVGEKAGTGSFIVKGFENTPLEMVEVPDRALLSEVVCLLRSTRDKAKKAAAVDPEFSAPKLVFSSLTSLQGLSKAVSADSTKVEAGASLLLDAVSHAVLCLQKLHNGRLAATLALLGDAPESTIQGWENERAVRRLQEAVLPRNGLVATAILWATGLILIIAVLMATCAMFGMPLTKDTLLYSGVKLD